MTDLSYFHRMNIKVEADAATPERQQRVSDLQPLEPGPNLRWWAACAVASGLIWLGVYYGVGWAAARFLVWWWR